MVSAVPLVRLHAELEPCDAFRFVDADDVFGEVQPGCDPWFADWTQPDGGDDDDAGRDGGDAGGGVVWVQS